MPEYKVETTKAGKTTYVKVDRHYDMSLRRKTGKRW